jgi:hypothetical protein
MINGSFAPEFIELTDEEVKFNCQIVNSLNSELASCYAQNQTLMLNHLRGQFFESHAIVCTIAGTQEKKVIATQLIPLGSLLGLYFGTAYPMDYAGLDQHALDITKYEQILDINGNLIVTYKVVGELNGKQTMAATMNHAYSIDIIKDLYAFSDNDTINHVGVVNTRQVYFRMTLVNFDNKQPVQVSVIIATQNIYPGDALHYSYDNPYMTSPAFPGYWKSRHKMPLLLTKAGDYLPQHLYTINQPFSSPPLSSGKQTTSGQLRWGRLITIILAIIMISFYLNYRNSTNNQANQNSPAANQ